MDRIDRQILSLLQKDAAMSVSDIGRKVGLTTTPCWRRIQNLEEGGVIQKRVTLLNAKAVNASVTVFVSIRTNHHNIDWVKKFEKVVREFPQVMELYRMSGDVDYLLRVVVADIDAYDAFYQNLISKIDITDVSSSFAMEQMKYTTELPLERLLD